jgi:hypothetical protein
MHSKCQEQLVQTLQHNIVGDLSCSNITIGTSNLAHIHTHTQKKVADIICQCRAVAYEMFKHTKYEYHE